LYRSNDGGRTWRRIAATGRTAALAFDREVPRTVILATGPKIVRSRDGGRTWSPFVDGLPPVGGLPFDPEASAPRLVLGLVATAAGAFAATWGGIYSVEFPEVGP
jgi:photosystem II stability/assembly factor-like uncharacterized protein